jgi:CRAL/TRIO, N-terminal domain
MLSRLSRILRGSANTPRIFKHSPLERTFRYSYTQPPRYKRTYVVCAVGIISAVSISNEDDMAPLELPGRPGNLTEEQVVKLKEMWSTAFKVFGIPVSNDTAVEETSEITVVDTVDTTKEKKGKKMGSLFRKKGKEASPAPSTREGSVDISKLAITDGDDKYSQTKEFKEALATSTPQQIHDTFWRMVKADHPDALFLRFLRARKWDVGKAMVMLVATMHWRSAELDVAFSMDCVDYRSRI